MHIAAALVFPGEYKKKRAATRSMPLIFLRGCMHFAAHGRLDARKQIPVPYLQYSTPRPDSEQREEAAASPPSEIDK